MKVRLTAEFDDETGDVSASIRVDDGLSLSPGNTAKVYFRPLLILFTTYRLWSVQGQPEVEFQLDLDKEDYPAEDIVGRLHELRTNSTKRRKDRETGEYLESDHWARDLFKSKDSGKPIFKTSQTAVWPGSELLSGRNVEIRLGRQQLDDVENLKAFLKLLKLNCVPAERLMFRYAGIREELRYSVWFGDEPENDKLGKLLTKNDYHYFHAEATFYRLPLSFQDHFRIGLVETGKHLLKSIGDSFKKGMIFREVYSVLDKDRPVLKRFQDELRKAPATEIEACLDQLFHVRVTVDDYPAKLEGVDVDPDGRNYSLKYKLPEECLSRLRLHFKIDAHGFQPRFQNSLPMVISEPTRDVVQHFYYQNASIENVGYFIGATVGPDGTRVEPAHDEEQKFVRATSPEGVFLSPGEGTVVFWTPLLKADRVRLVRLNEAEHGILDPRYSTTDNIFQEAIYKSSEMFLVSDVANKLREVHARLHEKHGYKLKIWDAYRPPSAHNLMARRRPDLVKHMTDPDIGSNHSRGCAVDVTLADDQGKESRDADEVRQDLHRGGDPRLDFTTAGGRRDQAAIFNIRSLHDREWF